MDIMTTYHLTFLGLLIILVTLMAQSLVAAVVHRMQKKYIPGIVDSKLDHKSFVFRSHRTAINSLETVPYMIAAIITALLIGLDAETLGAITLAYAIVRIVYTALFYAIATNKNPSLRSLAWVVGLIIQITLLVQIGFHLI